MPEQAGPRINLVKNKAGVAASSKNEVTKKERTAVLQVQVLHHDKSQSKQAGEEEARGGGGGGGRQEQADLDAHTLAGRNQITV